MLKHIVIDGIHAMVQDCDSKFWEDKGAEDFQGEFEWGFMVPVFYPIKNKYGYTKVITEQKNVDYFIKDGASTSTENFKEGSDQPEKKEPNKRGPKPKSTTNEA